MFDRVLIDDNEWYMSIGWLGAGALKVTKPGAGRTEKASPELKSHIVNIFYALSKRGFDITPNNPSVKELLHGFAELVWEPDGLMTRTVLSQDPNEIAERMLSSQGT